MRKPVVAAIAIVAVAMLSLATPASAVFSVEVERVKIGLGGEIKAGSLHGRGYIDVTFTVPKPNFIDSASITDLGAEFSLGAPTPGGEHVVYEAILPAGSVVCRVAKGSDKDVCHLTHAGRSASGLEHLSMTRGSEGSWRVTLHDAHLQLPNVDYSNVRFRYTLGGDFAAGQVTMTLKGRAWVSE